MYRVVLSVLVACLILTGCAGEATPDPTAVAQAVAETLTAQAPTMTPSPTGTRIPTATPTPTVAPTVTPTIPPTDTPAPRDTPTPTDTPFPTATPTTRPTATPTVAVPAGWKLYEDIVGRFSFMHPPGWEIDDQRAGIVTFVPEEWAFVGVKIESIPDISPVGVDDEASLNYVVMREAEIRDQRQFKLLDKGKWQDVGFFVSCTAKLPNSDTSEYRMLIAIPVGSGDVVMLRSAKAFSPIPEEWIDDFETVLGTLNVPGGATARAIPAPTPTSASTDGLTAVVNKSCNLREGPGTDYPVVGGAKSDDVVELLGRNEAGDWLYVKADVGRVWIAAFLLEHGDIGDLPVKESMAPTVTPPPPPTPTPVPLVTTGIGDEIEGAGWRFKVSEIHKRKAVYFYDYSHVAHGHFLVVIIDATNVQSGSDYFANNLVPAITDESHNKYMPSAKGTRYARWQYGGLTDVFTDVNPGAFARIALAYDLPDHLGAIALITPLGHRIDLGDFSAMPLEE